MRNPVVAAAASNGLRRQVHLSMVDAFQATMFHFREGAVMNSNSSMLKSIVVATALIAGVSGIARADDNSMGRFGGDSYAYFSSAGVDAAPSTWRQANPNGVSERQLQALASEGLGYDSDRPSFDRTPSTWRQANPNGVAEKELQALTSEGPAWHRSNELGTGALASTNESAVVAVTGNR